MARWELAAADFEKAPRFVIFDQALAGSQAIVHSVFARTFVESFADSVITSADAHRKSNTGAEGCIRVRKQYFKTGRKTVVNCNTLLLTSIMTQRAVAFCGSPNYQNPQGLDRCTADLGISCMGPWPEITEGLQ